MLPVFVFSLTFYFAWGMKGGCPAKHGEAPWLVFIRNCGAGVPQYSEEVHIIIQQPNEMIPEESTTKKVRPPKRPKNPPPPIPTQPSPTTQRVPKRPAPPIPTQRVTQPSRTTQKVPKRPNNTPPPIQKVTVTSYNVTRPTIQIISVDKVPEIPSCPIPPYVPIQSLPPPEKVVPSILRPMSHSGAQESYTNAPVGPQVPYIPPDFAFTGSLKNTSKPTDYYGDPKYPDVYRYQKADACLRPYPGYGRVNSMPPLKPGVQPASHYRPDINSGTDNCKPSSACLEFKMPPVYESLYPPKEIEPSGTESPMLRSACCFPKKPKKVPKALSTPVCSGIILTRRLVLTSATCVISAQAAYDRLSHLQVIAGATSLNDSCNQISNVQEIKALPNYERKNPTGRDLAVLVLMQPLHFEACRVWPMKLPPSNHVPKHRSMCSVYGWGTIQDPKKKEMKSELSVAQVQIKWVDDCWPYFPTKLNAKNHRSTICSTKSGHKLFVGDFGGPLVCRVGSEVDVLVGISTQMKIKWWRKSKSLYTNVASYLKWIEAEMALTTNRDSSGSSAKLIIDTFLFLSIFVIKLHL